jgi:hypothetical protein
VASLNSDNRLRNATDFGQNTLIITIARKEG